MARQHICFIVPGSTVPHIACVVHMSVALGTAYRQYFGVLSERIESFGSRTQLLLETCIRRSL